jgi:hypothetical protein
MRRLSHAFRERWQTMGALARHLPHCKARSSIGGTAYWIDGPPQLDARETGRRASSRHPDRAWRHQLLGSCRRATPSASASFHSHRPHRTRPASSATSSHAAGEIGAALDDLRPP